MSPRSWLRVAAVLAAVTAGTLVFVSSHRGRSPATHRAELIAANGLTLRIVRDGRGPAVILLHGFGESLLSWSGVFDELAQHADVVAIDMPGFGLSDKPATGYSDTALARTVLALMDRLAIPHATLVGHSMGGAVAVAAALEAPGRVDGLVLVDPAVSAATWGFRPPADSGGDAGWMRAAIAHYETMRAAVNSAHNPNWLTEPPASVRYSPVNDPAYGPALEAVLREFDWDYLTPARARALGQRVLLIWGEFDPVVPPAVGRTLLTGLPRARLFIIPRSLHRPHVERPDTVAALIEGFLGGQISF